MSDEIDPAATEAAQLIWAMLARLVARDDQSDHDAGVLTDQIIELLGSELRTISVLIESVALLLQAVRVAPADLQRLAAVIGSIRSVDHPGQA